MSPTSLLSVNEDEQSPELDAQLPTPRETPQPERQPATALISDTLFDHPEVFLESSEGIPGRTYTAPSGNPMLIVVDRSGVFDIEMVFCVCSDRNNKDEQLLRSGLLPATFKSIKTLFTFSVLDDFLRDNLECKTTAQQYYSKLQSTTSRMFPNLVPACLPPYVHLY
jgi:CxC2 like cysteine cluster associated with KDZ transposases